MDRQRVATAVLGTIVVWVSLSAARAVDSRAALEAFANPSAGYAVAPLWVWNDMLSEDQVRDTLRDMAAQKVMQVFVHPRPGLMTPYLSEEWFKLWQAALDEGTKLGMNVWIYDENSYPSGFAGGHVADQMPESRGQGLGFRPADETLKVDADVIGVYQADGGPFRNVTASAKAGSLPKGKYLVAHLVHATPNPWNADRPYVNLITPGVTEKFLAITLEPHRQHFGSEFGKRIPGAFTDEPELRPANGLPWASDLPEVFEKQWKYSLIDNLPSLSGDAGDFRKVRHDYLYVLNQLFIDRWAKPYYEYCEKNKLEFTGHYWEHEWPQCLMVPDNMAMYAWHQRPSIDNLGINYSEELHSQFGNTRTGKELSSVANQMGRARTLCEAYGAGGWECRFEDMKRIGDWLYALGINTLDPHLSYISIRGARKHDHPQSFSYHSPWWEAYHISAEYFARLSAALSQGKQINDVLLIEPTTTAWMYNYEPYPPRLAEIGKSFEAMIRTWEQNQIEYDLGSEDIIARHGSVDVKAKAFVVGQRRYGLVVLPPMTENLDSKTVELLEQYVQAGGNVMACGEPAGLVDARQSERVKALAKHSSWLQLAEEKAMAAVRGRQWATGLTIIPTATAAGQVFHHRRELEDGDLLFLVNTRNDKPALGLVASTKARAIAKWNLETGKSEAYPSRRNGKKLEISYELPPCGSLLVFLSNKPGELPPAATPRPEKLAALTALEIKRLAPNVLVLDFADVTCGGETKKSANAMKTANWVFAKHGLQKNPWDRAVQFKDELIKKTFPADSGFEASYHFAIEGQVPTQLFAVVERPDLYTVTCNGKPVSVRPAGASPTADAWWLDKQFGKMDIAASAQVGDNTLTIKAVPMTMYHELASAYIIGEFSVRPADKGFAIIPEQKLRLGPWNDQGCRLYGHRVGYSQKFNVAEKKGRYQVEIPSWYGSVAKVVVNGKAAGYIGWQPWQCEITEQVVAGANEVEVIIFGTLRNTLGPSHYQGAGLIGPFAWDGAPDSGPPAGKDYFSIGYGLFEPFVLKQIVD